MRLLLPILFLFTSCSSKTDKFHIWNELSSAEARPIIEKSLYLFENNLPIDVENVVDEIYKNCHLVDFDNDKDLDIIYTGWSGAEGDCIRIFINRNGKYLLQSFLWGKLTNIRLDKGVGYKFYIYSVGCCADPISLEYQVSIQTLNDSLETEFNSMILHNENTLGPILELDKYIKFQITKDSYNLRFEPKIDTSSIYSPGDQIGNIYATYKKGDSGIAAGSEEDETGRLWWYVKMNPLKNDTLNNIYREYGVIPRYAGWMSSRYLEEFRQQ